MIRPATVPDWSDTHSGPLDPRYGTARAAFEAGFAALPSWAEHALRLRDAVVGRLGLATVTGDGLSMVTLPVLQETPELYEVGLKDKHLTFTLTTMIAVGRVTVTTAIWFNHWTGRLYLGVVMIPHKLILRHALKALS